MNTHGENLTRVYASIGTAVVSFCRERIGHEFYASELRSYVTARFPGIAPESPGRILRELKLRGVIDYDLVSRAQSLYRVVMVRVSR